MSDGPAFDDCGFLGGRLRLRQFCSGHRVGTDAVLLAAAADLKPGEHLVEVGAGVGAVALAVLSRVADATALLVERDPATAEIAAFNVEANGFSPRVRVLQADVFDKRACRSMQAEGADLVLCNPPFFEAERVRPTAEPRRRAAHVLEHPLAEWWRRLAACLRPAGRLILILRPEALPALLSTSLGSIGAITVRPIHARADRPAIRIILSAVAGSKAPFALRPSLHLHDEAGQLTAEARDLHEGRTTLA